MLRFVAELACSVCAHTDDNHVHAAREMLFGARERFSYLECADCGSLELLDVPTSLSPYYPSDYYSLASLPPLRKGRLYSVRRLRARTALRWHGFARVAYGPRMPPWVGWFQGLGLPTSILDVGCGSGRTLFNLWQEGLSELTGCDPHLDESSDNGAVRLIKADPAALDGRFDVVMALNSFEHMADPHRTMDVLKKLAGRRIVVDVPVPGYSWRTYGVNWLGLDAPRHLHLLTPEGMRRLADAHGLRVAHWYFVSASMYLWGSEQYAADIPWRDERSYAENPDALTANQAAEYDRRADELRAAGDGDQAVFLLEPRRPD
jgi:SAM-dependent methyltransferase